jgi:hypothetical protein
MRRHALGDARQILGGGDGPIEPTGSDWIDRILAGKEPDRRSRRAPPLTQECEELRGEHHIAMPLPLALLDPQRHPLAVDIGHLQVRDLRHAQAGAVGDAERGLVLETRRGFEQSRHLLLAQHDRGLARLVHEPQRTNEVGPFERHGEEEPQRADSGVDRSWADLLLRHMQLKAAKIIARGRVRRPSEEGREAPDVPDVGLLHFLAVTPRRHVVDQALTQRVDGLVGHSESSCLAWG